MYKYGLRVKKTGKILCYTSEPNDGRDFCFETTYTLDTYGDKYWLVDTPEDAEYVRNFSTEWYNAVYETPKRNSFEPEELEVVRIEIIEDIQPVDVKIPTVEEYLEEKYAKSDPGHYKYCMEHIKHGIKYTLYDLHELLTARKERK